MQAALEAIEVEIEPLPVISSITEALDEETLPIHPRLAKENPEKLNVLKHLHIHKGNPQAGFESADLVYEQSYRVPFVEHASMETETSVGLVEEDGTFLVRHGAADMRQGSEQVVAVITSRVLGVPVAQVRAHTGDTRKYTPVGMTTASRATFITGNAVKLAAEGLRKALWHEISEVFDVDPNDLVIENEHFVELSTGQKVCSLEEIASKSEHFHFEAEYQAPKTQPLSERITSPS